MCILVKIHQKARETVTWGRLYYSITKYNIDIELLELLEPCRYNSYQMIKSSLMMATHTFINNLAAAILC